MYYGRSQTSGENIFARELQNVLRRHNLDLSRLDDRVGIHPEKVRRLVQSISGPKSFPVLNVEEMDQLIAILNLSEDEIIRLRAAVLAASVERTLMDRINQDDALQGANQIFPTILRALEEESESNEGLGNPRGGPDMTANDNSDLDEVFRSVYVALDAGEDALDLSSRMSSTRKSSQLKLAAAQFSQAIEALKELPSSMHTIGEWRYLQQQAQKGLHSAQEQLARL